MPCFIHDYEPDGRVATPAKSVSCEQQYSRPRKSKEVNNLSRSASCHTSCEPKLSPMVNNVSSRANQTVQQHTSISMISDDCKIQDVVEVQILPQNENWGDNTTALTSERSVSMEDFGKWMLDPETNFTFRCQRYIGSCISSLLSVLAFLSPIVMILLPKLNVIALRREQLKCNTECEGMLISFAFKLLILLVGTFILFFRQPSATLPRVFVFRALVVSLIFLFTFAYWLFYIVRVLENREDIQFQSLVGFAGSLVDSLLFIHYLAVILIELRQLQPQYVIKVVRSPDGESRSYSVGQLSIQRTSVFVLQKYYSDFPIYNPYLERLPVGKKSGSKFKYYEIDGTATSVSQEPTRAFSSSSTKRRDSSHNERFYEEHEYERRVRKRRARLVSAAEEAFVHIRRLHRDQAPGSPLGPYEAAQAIFPSMAKPLQKYLRVTRQQPRHTMESVLQDLAVCLSYDLSPRTFLEKFLNCSPVLTSDKEKKSVQSWALICDTLLSRSIKHDTVFQLRQRDVSLFCHVTKLPHFNMTEEMIDPKCNRFVLRVGSETSV